jgi:hypothetical protein
MKVLVLELIIRWALEVPTIRSNYMTTMHVTKPAVRFRINESKVGTELHEVTLINCCKKLISGVHIFGKI